MMKDALERLVRAARTAKKTDDALRNAGYDNTPYFEIFGDIVDGIYELLDENTGTLNESVAYEAICDPYMSDTESAKRLEYEYQQSHIDADIPDYAMEILENAADGLNITPVSMVKLILNEWVMNRRRSALAK